MNTYAQPVPRPTQRFRFDAIDLVGFVLFFLFWTVAGTVQGMVHGAPAGAIYVLVAGTLAYKTNSFKGLLRAIFLLVLVGFLQAIFSTTDLKDPIFWAYLIMWPPILMLEEM